jgi:hypothetical protein
VPATPARRVLIIAQSDGFANGVRPTAIADFLRGRGHDVEMVNTYYLSRLSRRPGTLANRLPHPSPGRFLMYLGEGLNLVLRRTEATRRTLAYPLLRTDYLLRSRVLPRLLPLDDFDLVMAVHPQDGGVLPRVRGTRTFYDCQTPYADELSYEGLVTPWQHRRARRHEIELYRAVDHLTFTWQTYASYVESHYGITLHNLCQLNWGCDLDTQRAQFASPPRIAYMGSLSSRFIDLPLLGRLSALYPGIDVFGGPPPDPALGLNYRGWAEPSVLRDYQFGLITCTKDDLRSEGFSAKHLEYIGHGLPVLVPAWRRRLDLFQGSIPYTEESFLALIQTHSTPEAWGAVSDTAWAQAQRLTWERTLQPLAELVESLPERRA